MFDTVSNLQKLERELMAVAKEADGQKAKAGHRTSEAALLQDDCSALQDEIQYKMSANLKTLAQQYEKNIEAVRSDAEKSKFDSDREEKMSNRHGRKSRKYERGSRVSLLVPVGKIIAPIFEHKATTHGYKQAQAQISSLSLRHQYEERTSDAETLKASAEQDLERLRGQTEQAYGECKKCKEEAERLERDAKMAVDAYSALRNHAGKLSKSLAPISMLDFRSREDWKSFQAMANECIMGVTQKVWEEKNLLQSGVGILVIENLE
ncbi:hypothetical protein SLS63_011527 [Diaporthe eres]|uniref:Uncharacterized protein n=1 Tax=Diaporthe eres TaxID=83184 RepID=A0ABR1NTY2_DIAER